MSLMRVQPRGIAQQRSEVEPFTTDVDRLFNWAFGAGMPADFTGLTPAVELIEENDHYVVRAELPGLKSEDVEISYQDGLLTLQGEKRSTSEKRTGRVHHQERFFGRFSRTIRVPQKIETNKIEASFLNGVLEVKMPFRADAQPKKIEIQAK